MKKQFDWLSIYNVIPDVLDCPAQNPPKPRFMVWYEATANMHAKKACEDVINDAIVVTCSEKPESSK